MARAKVLEPFYDLEAKADRAKGEEFEASEERIEAINAAGFGQLVEKAAEPAPKKAPAKAKAKAGE